MFNTNIDDILNSISRNNLRGYNINYYDNSNIESSGLSNIPNTINIYNRTNINNNRGENSLSNGNNYIPILRSNVRQPNRLYYNNSSNRNWFDTNSLFDSYNTNNLFTRNSSLSNRFPNTNTNTTSTTTNSNSAPRSSVFSPLSRTRRRTNNTNTSATPAAGPASSVSYIFEISDNHQINPNSVDLDTLLDKTEIVILSESNRNEYNDDRCSICSQEFNRNSTEIVRKIRGCNHYFHLTCIDRWFASNSTCPICRTDLNNNEEETLQNQNQNNSDTDNGADATLDDNSNQENNGNTANTTRTSLNI